MRYEIRDISPPAGVRSAMELQVTCLSLLVVIMSNTSLSLLLVLITGVPVNATNNCSCRDTDPV